MAPGDFRDRLLKGLGGPLWFSFTKQNSPQSIVPGSNIAVLSDDSFEGLLCLLQITQSQVNVADPILGGMTLDGVIGSQFLLSFLEPGDSPSRPR